MSNSRIDIFKGQLFSDKDIALEGQLSFKQKIAVQGFVSYHMCDAKSKAQKKFKAYTLFANSPRQSHFAIQEELSQYLDTLDIFKIYKYVENKAIPMKLWADKVIDDIKDIKTKQAMSSIFVNYCDLLTNGDDSPMSMFNGDYRLALYLCRAILEDATAESLQKVATIILNSIAEEVGYNVEVRDTIFINVDDKSYKKDLNLIQGMDYNINSFMPMSLSHQLDEYTGKDIEDIKFSKEDIVDLMKQCLEDNEGMPANVKKKELETLVQGLVEEGYSTELVRECLMELEHNISLSELTTVEQKVYTVQKVSKAIDRRIVSSTMFNSLEEAVEYINNIKCNFPDVAENFDFVIQDNEEE